VFSLIGRYKRTLEEQIEEDSERIRPVGEVRFARFAGRTATSAPQPTLSELAKLPGKAIAQRQRVALSPAAIRPRPTVGLGLALQPR
jgi:hypothetical protein